MVGSLQLAARMLGIDRDRTARGALAGTAAGGRAPGGPPRSWRWGSSAGRSLDKRLFASSYDDAELLGTAVVRGPAAYPVGVALHLANGALFGALYANVAPLIPLPPWSRGPIAGMVENFGLWPLGRLSDRFHPARDDLPRLSGNRRALWQATWRHLLFGVALGELERRLNPPADEPTSVYEDYVSSNGHRDLEEVASAAGLDG